MSSDAYDSWHFDLIGGAVVTTPAADEIPIKARLSWTVTALGTLCFLIYLGDNPVPAVRILGPGHPLRFSEATVSAFASLAEPLRADSAT